MFFVSCKKTYVARVRLQIIIFSGSKDQVFMVKAEDVRMSKFHVVRLYIYLRKVFFQWVGQASNIAKHLNKVVPRVRLCCCICMFKKEKREKSYLRMFSSAVLITIEYLYTIYVGLLCSQDCLCFQPINRSQAHKSMRWSFYARFHNKMLLLCTIPHYLFLLRA